jgi:GT2 family glycosyltransferase
MPDRSAACKNAVWTGLIRRSLVEGSTIEGASVSFSDQYVRAKLLVVDEEQPQSWKEVDLPKGSTFEDLRRSALQGLPKISTLPKPPESERSVSVAIPTHERPEHLNRCLGSLRAAIAGVPGAEIIVVDNANRTDRTERVVDDWRRRGLPVRRVSEVRAGTSRARNCALRSADSELVAFVDDDVVVDPAWLRGIRRGFSLDAGVVTGLVAPAELETEAQLLFERKMRWSNIRSREVYSIKSQKKYDFPFPFMAGNFGAAANMAVDREVALSIGGFDESLGPGTYCRGGEDFEFFVRSLRRGIRLAFEPTALAWHFHRRELTELRSQLFGYGVGMTGYLARTAAQPGRLRMAIVVAGAAKSLVGTRTREVSEGLPRSYAFAEFGGMLWGLGSFAREQSKRHHLQ